MPKNKPAYEVYELCKNQVVTVGMGQPIDIDLKTVFDAIREYPDGIKDKWKCVMKVREAWHRFAGRFKSDGD